MLAKNSIRFKMENYLDCCKVFEILEKPYQGVDFPGYDNVLIDFSTLEILVANQKDDWRVALENMKGIYLIADKNNGKKYVGSASGDYGIWSRWCTYANTAHGDNDMLVELIKKKGWTMRANISNFLFWKYGRCTLQQIQSSIEKATGRKFF